MSMSCKKVTRVAGLVLALGFGPLLATSQQQVNQATAFIPLPVPGGPIPDAKRNFRPNDMGLIDKLVVHESMRWVRGFFTTLGFLDDSIQGSEVLHAGLLRSVDLRHPVPDLEFVVTDPVTGAWEQGSGPSNWLVQPPIENWNADLGGDVNPPWAKGRSLQGLVSEQGMLFVSGAGRNGKPPNASTELWNGLSKLDGTAPPADAFDPTDGELWSAGGGAPDYAKAAPEGNTVARTRNGDRFLFQANYCGEEAAGKLLVQGINNLLSIDPTERVLIDIQQLLIDYSVTASAGPLGFEHDPANGFDLSLSLIDSSGNRR